MELSREKLFEAAELAKPALADKDLIEQCTHLWLDGKSLTAYDDASLGIQVPFASELKGGLRGSVLLGFLAHGGGDKLEVQLEDKGEALLKIGRSRLRLALMPVDRAIWELPKLGKVKPYRLSSGFLEALKAVRISLGPGSAKAEQLGVTLMLQGGLQLYASDDKTIAWSTLKQIKDWPLKPGERVTIPTAFVEQLIRLGSENTDLWITSNEVMAEREDGVILFARLVNVQKFTDFKSVIDTELKGMQMFDIPARLKLGLDRVGIMLEGEEAVDMWFQDNTLRIHAKAAFGELKDVIDLEVHPEPIEFKVSPELMKRGMDLCLTMGASVRATIMANKENFLYLIQNMA